MLLRRNSKSDMAKCNSEFLRPPALISSAGLVYNQTMTDLQIISIRAAEQSGLKHYFTGKPCRNGHLGPRYVSTWRCVQCTVERVITWQVNNPEKKRAKQNRYQSRKSKGQKLADSRRDHTTERQRREAKLAEIAGRPRPMVCEVCGEDNKRRKDVIAFDHCHKTGKFRGWLCDRCNMTIGAAEDRPDLLRELANYLERANQESGTTV